MKKSWAGLAYIGLMAALALGTARAEDPLAACESQIVALSNQARQEKGLAPLAVSTYLHSAATEHSSEMARLAYFDHESPTPGLRYPWDRLNRAGADSMRVSENIFYLDGYPLEQVAAKTVGTWLKSAEHRGNMLDPKVTQVGVGVCLRGNRTYITQDLSAALIPVTSPQTPEPDR